MIRFFKRWSFPILWIISTILLFLIILLTNNEISIWPPDISSNGLSLFVRIFSIPLYFFAAGIPIYGIIISLKRMQQSEKQFSLLMYSSYYKHLEEFIAFFKTANSNDIQIIVNRMRENPELLYRKWHELWFGTEKEFDHSAKNSTINDAKNFLSTVSIIRELVLHNEEIDEDLLIPVKDELAELGISLPEDVIHSVQHEGTVGEFQSALKIIVTILHFSGVRIELDEHIRLLVE